MSATRASHHKCPVNGCTATRPQSILMCARHWRLVPSPMQKAVWRAWQNGGSAEYLAAREAAIKAVESELRSADAFGIKV